MSWFTDRPRIGHFGRCRHGLCQETPTKFLGDWKGYAGYCEAHRPTEAEVEKMYDEYIERQRESARNKRFMRRHNE